MEDLKMYEIISSPVCIECGKTFTIESGRGLSTFTCECERDKIVRDRDMIVMENIIDAYGQSLYVNGLVEWKGTVKSSVDAVEYFLALGIFAEMGKEEFVDTMRKYRRGMNGTVHSV